MSSEPLPEEKQLQMLLVLAVVNGLVADGSAVANNAWVNGLVANGSAVANNAWVAWTWVASEAHERG